MEESAHGSFDDYVPDELLLEVLTWLTVPDLLRNAICVSPRFRHILQNHLLWNRKLLCDYYSDDGVGDLASNDESSLTIHQLQRICYFQETKLQESSPSCLLVGPVLVRRGTANALMRGPRNIARKKLVCLASSTDHHHEGLENALPEDAWNGREDSEHGLVDWDAIRSVDRSSNITFQETSRSSPFSFSQPWWSSKPRYDDDSREVLAFSTRYPLSMISEVAIKPVSERFEQHGDCVTNVTGII